MAKDRRSSGSATILILIITGVVINALGGGVRSNFGIIIQPLTEYSGVGYASISFILGIAQLMYGVTQPLWGMLALKRSNTQVLLSHSGAVMFISLGLMVGCGAGALCFGMIMGAISPFLDSQKAAAASGILNAGSGIGGAALSPVIQQVSSSAGISTALVMLAAPFIFMMPVVLWMKRKETGSNCDDLSQDSQNLPAHLPSSGRL